ncbi:hypothetical protein H920_15389 [Fukomys damarensis]|uniref:Uncharacterized protein n=1 Tax=Fukomys damarensis TaxID=885580 RepID=A0A091CUL7_FUKDA|nr:hypothetical protein H920_15389 [Fukomys damarensis]
MSVPAPEDGVGSGNITLQIHIQWELMRLLQNMVIKSFLKTAPKKILNKSTTTTSPKKTAPKKILNKSTSTSHKHRSQPTILPQRRSNFLAVVKQNALQTLNLHVSSKIKVRGITITITVTIVTPLDAGPVDVHRIDQKANSAKAPCSEVCPQNVSGANLFLSSLRHTPVLSQQQSPTGRFTFQHYPGPRRNPLGVTVVLRKGIQIRPQICPKGTPFSPSKKQAAPPGAADTPRSSTLASSPASCDTGSLSASVPQPRAATLTWTWLRTGISLAF